MYSLHVPSSSFSCSDPSLLYYVFEKIGHLQKLKKQKKDAHSTTNDCVVAHTQRQRIKKNVAAEGFPYVCRQRNTK